MVENEVRSDGMHSSRRASLQELPNRVTSDGMYPSRRASLGQPPTSCTHSLVMCVFKSEVPTSTQALLPTSTHSNGFCIIRVCISSSPSSSWRSGKVSVVASRYWNEASVQIDSHLLVLRWQRNLRFSKYFKPTSSIC